MSRVQLVNSLATRIGDYRAGDIAPIDAAHVDRWVSQFTQDEQLRVLAELDHILSKSYVRRSDFEAFALDAVTNADLVGDDSCAFWAAARFFNQQLRGQSQGIMLDLFDAALKQECGLSAYSDTDGEGRLVYVDDAVYTGMHVINDLTPIIAAAPKHTDLFMFVYALHNQGAQYATQQLTSRFRAAGKTVNFKWWCQLDLENSLASTSDVLWPSSVPEHQETKDYAASLSHRLILRPGDGVGKNNFFSSGARRHLIEQEFLMAGSVIRSQSQHLKQYARPLGNRIMESFGFGALVVTFRNCANNCPLVFWAGNHPLFERDNN